jgi:Protein of unknown function (DUF1203)
MTFQIEGIPIRRFAPLFGLPDEALAAVGAVRRIADRKPGFPCRVSLADAEPGESVLLVNFLHQPAATPYRARYAIYVRECARDAELAPGEVPEVLRGRLLSLRAFDAAGWLLEADVVEGRSLEPALQRLLAPSAVACVHIHNAKPGCYAARAVRAAL